MHYWINQDGVQAGPLSIEELKQMSITPSTYVWHSGMPDWQQISEIEELNSILFGSALPESVPEAIIEEPELTEEPEADDTGATGIEPEETPEAPYIAALSHETFTMSPADADSPDMSQCPPTNLGWSIATTIACCVPLGIVAIVLSLKVKPAYRSGDTAKALKWSEWSAWACIASIILGLIFSTIFSFVPGMFM